MRPPNPLIMADDVGGRLAVPLLWAVGPRVGQALPLHRAGTARLGAGAHGHAPLRPPAFARRVLPEGARRPFGKLKAVPSALLRDGERSRTVSEVEPRLAPASSLPTRTLSTD